MFPFDDVIMRYVGEIEIVVYNIAGAFVSTPMLQCGIEFYFLTVFYHARPGLFQKLS